MYIKAKYFENENIKMCTFKLTICLVSNVKTDYFENEKSAHESVFRSRWSYELCVKYSLICITIGEMG